MTVNDDLEKLIEFTFFKEHLNQHVYRDQLIEIVLDLGRRPEAFYYRARIFVAKIISWQDIDYTTKRISKFSNENRAGIERTP
jgi:stage III sporulation protein SpoIIIAA